MTIHVLVEGPSERAFLERWGGRLLKEQRLRVYPHEGKGSLPSNLKVRPNPRHRGLLDQLPAKLRGFEAILTPEDTVVVLVDADNDSQAELVDRIQRAAEKVAPRLRVVVHVAVEETEAFYLGDLRALQQAYPKADMKRARAYAPDSICGTWELFGHVIGDGGGNKVDWAEAMGPRVTVRPGGSRSPSFRSLLAGLVGLLPGKRSKQRPRSYRHPTKTRTDASRRR